MCRIYKSHCIFSELQISLKVVVPCRHVTSDNYLLRAVYFYDIRPFTAFELRFSGPHDLWPGGGNCKSRKIEKHHEKIEKQHEKIEKQHNNLERPISAVDKKGS